MISSPGSVIARTAFMNALLPPAVTSTRLFGLTLMWFSRASLPRSPPRAPAGLRPGRSDGRSACRRTARGRDGLGRRVVGDDALAQRDRPGRLGRPAADDGNDGSLHGREAPGLTVRGLSDVVAHDISITEALGLALGSGEICRNRGRKFCESLEPVVTSSVAGLSGTSA